MLVIANVHWRAFLLNIVLMLCKFGNLVIFVHLTNVNGKR